MAQSCYPSQRRRHRSPATAFGGLSVALFVFACGPSQEELRLAALQQDFETAGATIDSLNYTIESSNLLINEMRTRVDSLGGVNDKLLTSIRRLTGEVKNWRELATEHKRKSEQLSLEIERMKREKQTDTRAIASLRSQTDSLNSALLDAHTSIRRQEAHVKQMEQELGKSHDEVALLREAETSVRVYAATEDYLKESGYLETARSLRLFRKSFKLVRRIDPTDPRVHLVPIGESILIEGELDVVVDRFGKLKKGDGYKHKKTDIGVQLTFVDELLGGADVLVVLKN